MNPRYPKLKETLAKPIVFDFTSVRSSPGDVQAALSKLIGNLVAIAEERTIIAMKALEAIESAPDYTDESRAYSEPFLDLQQMEWAANYKGDPSNPDGVEYSTLKVIRIQVIHQWEWDGGMVCQFILVEYDWGNEKGVTFQNAEWRWRSRSVLSSGSPWHSYQDVADMGIEFRAEAQEAFFALARERKRNQDAS